MATFPSSRPPTAVGSDGFVGEDLAELQQLLLGPAEVELEPLGPEVVAVQRVVAVDADAAVEVLGGGGDALATFGHPELGGGDLGGGGQVVLQPPRRLEGGEAHALGVD